MCPKGPDQSLPLHGMVLGPAVLSPDGQTIVFSILNPVGGLYKVATDGTGFQPIISDEKFVVDPVFSPDGTKILFSLITDQKGAICEIRADGASQITSLTSGPNNDYSPVYSPDGSKIYFLRAQTFRNYSPIARPAWHDVDIYSMDADGKNVTKITHENNYAMSTLSISPQGEALVKMGIDDPVWLVPLNDPSNKTHVGPDLDKHQDIDYSPMRNAQFSQDGAKVLYTVPDNEELYIMDRKTGTDERIWTWESAKAWTSPELREKRLPSRMYPRFSADGKRIVFSTATRYDIGPRGALQVLAICGKSVDPYAIMPKLWIINADGTGLQPVDIKVTEKEQGEAEAAPK